jgi:hypothetical protein
VGNRVPDIDDTNRFFRATPEVTSGSYGGFDKWAGRIESATKTGQAALDALPQIAPPEPGNLFNSDSLRDDVAGRNLLNSVTLPDNLLNVEERLHRAGY